MNRKRFFFSVVVSLKSNLNTKRVERNNNNKQQCPLKKEEKKNKVCFFIFPFSCVSFGIKMKEKKTFSCLCVAKDRPPPFFFSKKEEERTEGNTNYDRGLEWHGKLFGKKEGRILFFFFIRRGASLVDILYNNSTRVA
jgi:hypothetical protein